MTTPGSAHSCSLAAPSGLLRSCRAIMLTAALPPLLGCGWNPTRPFERNAPQVDQAIAALDAGEAGAAAQLLQAYLGTGECSSDSMGVPERARAQHNATFDLGLALFSLGEAYGPRFGDEDPTEEQEQPSPEQQQHAQLRSQNVECALRLLRAIAVAPGIPVELEARARYLEGNLEFLRRNYREAVVAYDQALQLVPGVEGDAGDAIGQDAAWNRAIALRRIEEEKNKDAAPDTPPDADAGQDAQADSAPDVQPDAPNDQGPDAEDEGGTEAGSPSPDAGNDGSDGDPDDKEQNEKPDAGAQDSAPPPTPNTTQDERILDMLEQAPTVQLLDAQTRASLRRSRRMVDK